MGTKPRSICLVAVELDGVVQNGGIGTANGELARLLARHGWQVHILYACPIPDRDVLKDARRRLAAESIHFTHIDELPTRSEAQVPDRLDQYHLQLSERVHHALRQLHGRHGFDLIEFADAAGTGFRAIQARRAGAAYADAGLLIKLHSMSQWLREGNQAWMTRADELLIDHLERQAFADADFQVSPSQHLFDYARRIGWRVRDDAAIVPYPLPAPVSAAPPLHGVAELVFFGRLEIRKGLDLFLSALEMLDPTIPVAFLGRDTLLEDGRRATAHIRQRLGRRPARLLTSLDRPAALAYLLSGPRVAVMPSLLENYANAVLECVVNGIPFVASNAGGTPEIVPADLHPYLLCPPTSEGLARRLQSYLAAPAAQREQWRQRLREARDPEKHNRLVVQRYARFAEDVREQASRQAPRAHFSDRRISVLIPANGRLDPHTHRETQIAESWSAVNGEFVMPLDSRTRLQPAALDRLAAALERNPDWSAVVAYSQGTVADRPTGGPFLLGSIANVYGDAPALFRTADLREAGTEPGSTWLTCVRLACAGKRIGVLPEVLFDRAAPPAVDHAEHMRIIEEYAGCASLPAEERFALWTALVSFHQQRTNCLKELFTDNLPLRYRLADRLNDAVKRAPWAHAAGRAVLDTGLTWGRRAARLARNLGRRVAPLS